MAKKENYRKSGAAARHRQQLRDEAVERQTKRDGRSNEQQIAVLRNRPGASKREIERLSK